MSKTTTSKAQIVLAMHLLHGIPKDIASKSYDAMMGIMQESLLEGKNVALKNIGTLEAELKCPGAIKIYGKEVQAGYRLSVKLKTSRSLTALVKQTYDPKLQTAKKMQEFLNRKKK